MKLLAPPSHHPPSSSPPAQNEFNGKTPNALSYLHINAPISFVWSLDTWLTSIVMNKINFGWYPPLFFIHLRVKHAQIHFGISRFEIIPGSPLLCHQLSTHHLFAIKQTYLLLGWYKIVVLRVIADANDFKEPPQSFHQASELFILQLLTEVEEGWRDFNLWRWSWQCNDWEDSFESLHTQHHQEELKRTFQKQQLDVQFNNAKGAIVIGNLSNRNVRFDRDLSPLPRSQAWEFSVRSWISTVSQWGLKSR